MLHVFDETYFLYAILGIENRSTAQISMHMHMYTFPIVCLLNTPLVSPGYKLPLTPPTSKWTCGAMDNASAYGAEDSRFESWQVRTFYRTHVEHFFLLDYMFTFFSPRVKSIQIVNLESLTRTIAFFTYKFPRWQEITICLHDLLVWHESTGIHKKGMQLSGRALALHVRGPGFNPRHLHTFSHYFQSRSIIMYQINHE